MRKSYLMIAAVATILASCANEKVLNDIQTNDQQTAIGFTSFSEKGTRGVDNPLDLEFYHGTFTVYGSKKATVGGAISEVFDGGATSLLTYSDGAVTPNDWTYSPYRFWDKQAAYKFIAVAPNANIVKYTWDAKASSLKEVGNDDFETVEGGYTLKGQNLQKKSTTAEIFKGFVEAPNNDVDIMTAELVSRDAAATSVVELTFKHILAKLNITIAKAAILKDAAVYVRSLEITGLKDKGTYAESDYADDDASTTDVNEQHSGWAPSVSDAEYKLAYNYAADDEATAQGKALTYNETDNAVVPNYFIESLVMPQAVADNTVTMTLKYRIVTGSGATAHSEDYTYEFDVNDAFQLFFDRHNYTIKFTIEPSVIKFDAVADSWKNETYNQTID